jgi:hypothetical protein
LNSIKQLCSLIKKAPKKAGVVRVPCLFIYSCAHCVLIVIGAIPVIIVGTTRPSWEVLENVSKKVTIVETRALGNHSTQVPGMLRVLVGFTIIMLIISFLCILMHAFANSHCIIIFLRR